MSAEPATVVRGLPRNGARLPRLARDLLRRKLADLDHGRLTVRDPWGEWSAGRGAGEARLTVSDPGFYLDVALEGGLGAARSWMDGLWHSDDLTAVRRFEDLPASLRDVIEFVEETCGARVSVVSTGPERDQTIRR